MLRYFNALIFSFALLVSSTSQAASSWGTSSSPSAIAACTSIMELAYAGWTVTAQASVVSATTAYCGGHVRANDGRPDPDRDIPIGTWIVSNSGTCDTGTTLNMTNGACEGATNKCTAAAGATTNWFWKSSSDTPDSSVSVNGCEATIGGFALCKNTTKGYYSCSGTATITGKELASSDKAETGSCTGAECTANDPQPETKNQDCVYSSATGAATCTATTSKSDPGTTSCGTVGSTWTCVEKIKSTSTDATLTSVKSEVSNANSTVTTTTNNTLVTTTCNGVKNCNVVKSTSVGTTTTDSSGKVTDSSSTCTGTSCTGTGTTAGTGDAVAGSGTGDDSEETDDDSPSPSTTPLTAPKQGSFDGQGDEWDKKIEQAKTDLKDATATIKNEFSDLSSLKLSGGAKLYCPPPVEVLHQSISFCLDDYAGSLSWIGDAVYLLCAVIALFIVFT